MDELLTIKIATLSQDFQYCLISSISLINMFFRFFCSKRKVIYLMNNRINYFPESKYVLRKSFITAPFNTCVQLELCIGS